MNGKVIAVLGISGVGKTTMVSSFVESHPSVLSIRASELLNRERPEANPEFFRIAASSDIHKNQDHITTAFDKFKRSAFGRHIIFDGHSLIDNGQGLVVIPIQIFRKIAPDIIIFIEENPEVIVSRRLADVSRTRPQRTVRELSEQQTLAKDTANEYGRVLSAPCHIVHSGDFEVFEYLLFKELGLDKDG